MSELIRSAKLQLRKSSLFTAYFNYKQRALYQRWLQEGKPLPPPHIVKQQAINSFQHNYKLPILIETGTYLGDMVNAMRDTFKQIYSIELSEELHKIAQDRFRRARNITILQGDSGEVLADLIKHITEPCLFWLDGHYSSGITAKGELETPIEKELTTIFQHPLAHQHIILIDDARCFNGKDDYPELSAIEQKARNAGYQNYQVENDIIRIFN